MTDSFQPLANHALTVYPHLKAPGFEASKVFALTALYLDKPPKNFPSPGYLRKNLASLYLFVIHPSHRASNGKLHPAYHTRMIPEMWYLSITNKSIQIGRGKPPTGLLGRRRRADIVIECNLATGKVRARALYESNRLIIGGKLDKALEIANVIKSERSKLYHVITKDPTPKEQNNVEFDENAHGYSIGSSVRARL